MSARFLSVSDAARELGVSRRHLYDLIARNEFPSVTLGRRILVPASAIDRLEANAVEVAS